ncbi:hypothetical protein [Moorena sp. SIOASIH]|uniref:hypothetical protein n=1 Tax=Moorena sp. SIOASIH TaxID=2607817 RepID=UPI0025CBC6E5|nr:hypothetical protein [Moorena sp. SIOASIH]
MIRNGASPKLEPNSTTSPITFKPTAVAHGGKPQDRNGAFSVMASNPLTVGHATRTPSRVAPLHRFRNFI